jgi:hypothetical protein
MFTAQGAALNKVASRNVKVLVVGKGSDGQSARGAESAIHPNTGMPRRRTSASSSWRRNGNDGAMNRWSCIRDGS